MEAKDITEIKNTQYKILVAIAGDSTTGVKGIVQTLDGHDGRISKLERFVEKTKRWRWFQLGAATSAGAAGGTVLAPALKSAIAKGLAFLISAIGTMLVILVIAVLVL